MKRYFDVSIHSLVLTAFIALAVTGRLDAPSIALFSVGLMWSLYRTLRRQPPLLSASATLYLSFSYVVFLVVDMLAISNSFVPATVHMVLFLALTKLHQGKSERDYFYLIVLAFLMILAAASLTIDISFLITLFLFLVALVSTLMSFEIVRSQKSNKRTQVAAASLTGVSIWSTIGIVVLGAAIFFVLPRVGTGYFNRVTVPPVLQSGFNDNVRLGEIGRIKQSFAVVMRAKHVSGKPAVGLRWRGIALDNFDGRTWHKTDTIRDEIQAVEGELYPIRILRNPGDAVRYNILLEPMATSTLFGPFMIRSVSTRVEGLLADHDDSVFTRFPQQRRIQYQVLAEVRDRSSATPGLSGLTNESRYLQLPRNIDPRVIELAKTITSGGSTPGEKASLIEAFLRKTYKYTLNLTWNPGAQPLNTFLFEAKNGHCEYFASAMAILARAAGIPTRLVNGFLTGEYNPVGADYIVRESDAHSWVEAYLPDRGWTEFDATPPDMRPADGSFGAQMSHFVDALELYWSSYILVYDDNSQSRLFHNAQNQAQSLESDVRSRSDRLSNGIREAVELWANAIRIVLADKRLWIILVSCGLAGAGFLNRAAIRTRWKIWKVRSGTGPISKDVIEYLFYRTAKLAQRGRPLKRPSQTWREWTLGLADSGRRSIALKALGVFERTCYSPEPASNADFRALEDAIRQLKR